MNTRQHALDSLNFARGVTESLLKAFPADKAAFQPAPTDNHMLWIVGHLAHSTHWFASLIDSEPIEGPNSVPSNYGQLFGANSKPQPDPRKYPPLTELRGHYDRAHQRLKAAIERSSDESLLKPVGEAGGGFVTHGLDCVIKCAWHEGWHGGQLSSLRRALGLPPTLGT